MLRLLYDINSALFLSITKGFWSRRVSPGTTHCGGCARAVTMHHCTIFMPLRVDTSFKDLQMHKNIVQSDISFLIVESDTLYSGRHVKYADHPRFCCSLHAEYAIKACVSQFSTQPGAIGRNKPFRR